MIQLQCDQFRWTGRKLMYTSTHDVTINLCRTWPLNWLMCFSYVCHKMLNVLVNIIKYQTKHPRWVELKPMRGNWATGGQEQRACSTFAFWLSRWWCTSNQWTTPKLCSILCGIQVHPIIFQSDVEEWVSGLFSWKKLSLQKVYLQTHQIALS